MTSLINHKIAASFGAKAAVYDAHTDLQDRIAARLAKALPREGVRRVLEVGCGTGHLSRRLVTLYPDAEIVLTDLSEKMLDRCRTRVGKAPGVQFLCVDGETLGNDGSPAFGPFDVIVSSMAIHWFQDPLAALDRFRLLLSAPGGMIFYSALGGNSFPEWRDYLKQEGEPSGILDVPDWPGAFEKTKEAFRYPSARAFFSEMKNMGASRSREGYRPLGAGRFRQLLRGFDARAQRGVSWEIIFGQVGV